MCLIVRECSWLLNMCSLIFLDCSILKMKCLLICFFKTVFATRLRWIMCCTVSNMSFFVYLSVHDFGLIFDDSFNMQDEMPFDVVLFKLCSQIDDFENWLNCVRLFDMLSDMEWFVIDVEWCDGFPKYNVVWRVSFVQFVNWCSSSCQYSNRKWCWCFPFKLCFWIDHVGSNYICCNMSDVIDR